MSYALTPKRLAAGLAVAFVATSALPIAAAATGPGSGGAGVAPPSAAAPKLRGGRWYHHVAVTEYWPAPEAWFVGALVSAPGLTAPHRIDWLYSAKGISMQGEGIGLDGQLYHLDAQGSGGWVTGAGKATSSLDGWASGAPYWRAGGYWANKRKRVTWPLAVGGWSHGPGLSYVPLRGITFAAGPAKPLAYYQSIAVDPSVIPLGSLLYIPAYRNDGHGGWFLAQDTGGGISGRHLDVFRPPPASTATPGRSLSGQAVYVIPPRA